MGKRIGQAVFVAQRIFIFRAVYGSGKGSGRTVVVKGVVGDLTFRRGVRFHGARIRIIRVSSGIAEGIGITQEISAVAVISAGRFHDRGTVRSGYFGYDGIKQHSGVFSNSAVRWIIQFLLLIYIHRI